MVIDNKLPATFGRIKQENNKFIFLEIIYDTVVKSSLCSEIEN